MQEFKHMKVAEFSFKMLSYIGLWRPMSLISLWPIRIYNLYTFIVLLLNSSFGFSFLINLYQNKHNTEVIMEDVFFFTTVFLIVFKISYINISRQDIISLVNKLLQKNSLPRNNEEAAVYKKFQDNERFSERIILTSTLVTATLYLLSPLIDRKNISLPIKSWVPGDINSKKIFWIFYAYQCFAIYYNCLAYSTTESLLLILMQQVCSQLEILRNRLLEIPSVRKKNYIKIDVHQEERNLIKNCINHHVCIFSMNYLLNNIFGLLISLQFFISILNLCSSGYYLTKISVSGPYFWLSIMIMGLFIFQIFLYCWFGEELTRKSLSISDQIYKMDWNLLSAETKQKLLVIMMRANYPMQLTGTSIIILSIETFFKVIKASYSSFNLLRNTN